MCSATWRKNVLKLSWRERVILSVNFYWHYSNFQKHRKQQKSWDKVTGWRFKLLCKFLFHSTPEQNFSIKTFLNISVPVQSFQKIPESSPVCISTVPQPVTHHSLLLAVLCLSCQQTAHSTLCMYLFKLFHSHMLMYTRPHNTNTHMHTKQLDSMCSWG